MKCVGVVAVLLLFVGVLSLALAQKEETKNEYGIAFPLEDASSVNSEKRIVPVGSVPGEGISPSTPEPSNQEPTVTPVSVSTEESPVTVTVLPEEGDKKPEEGEIRPNEHPAILIGSDEEERPGENGDEQTNPRIVFIERLMGLHLSAPIAQQGEKEQENNNGPQEIVQPGQFPMRNPFDKLNAKWASRMRKFSIPIMQQQQQPQPEQANPLLRYAAAAMMTRLLAAAARAHHQGPPIMAKDKDDDSEEETVPVLLATMRANAERASQMRSIPPMYGRPMPRPMMMRPPPMRPSLASYGHPQARMAPSIPQRAFASPSMPMPQRAPVIIPVLVSVPHAPMQQAESRMGAAPVVSTPYAYAPHHPPMPFYPQLSYAVPVPVPVPVPVYQHPAATYQRPVYHPAETYQNPVFQHPMASYQRPLSYQPRPSGSMQRPVIEVPVPVHVPIEIPVPIHVPFQAHQNGHNDQDQDASASEADQVAIVYYDSDGSEGSIDQGEDHMEPQAAESHESVMRLPPGPKGHHFLSRPLPDTQSPGKLKLWREFVGAKHAAQPGVRYVPVAIATEESQPQPGQDSHQVPEQHEAAESQSQPAFVIFADDAAEDQAQDH